MALKDSWVDKKDGDYILAEDINAVAHGVIDIEENLPETIEEKLGEAKESGEFDGNDGLSAYELALKNGTTTAKSEAEWLASLKGKDGKDGIDGERGLAYYRLKSNLVGSLEYYPFTDFLIPEGYVPKPYDLVLYNDGNLGYIYSVTEGEMRAAVAHIPNASLKGPIGPAGFSPTVSVSKRNGVATVTITDKDGTKTVDILDGSANGGIDPGIFIDNEDIIPETEVVLEGTPGASTMAFIHSDIKPIVGEIYGVFWNGTKYSCEAKLASNDYVVLGNGMVWGLPATNDPFCITFYNREDEDNVQVRSIDYLETVNLRVALPPMIDPKYIPNMYYTEGDDVVIPKISGTILAGEPMFIIDAFLPLEGEKEYNIKLNIDGVDAVDISNPQGSLTGTDDNGNAQAYILQLNSNMSLMTILPEFVDMTGGIKSVIQITEPYENDVTFELEVTTPTVVHQIDSKYIPDKEIKEFILSDLGVSLMADGTSSVNIPDGKRAEFAAACTSGQHIKLYAYLFDDPSKAISVTVAPIRRGLSTLGVQFQFSYYDLEDTKSIYYVSLTYFIETGLMKYSRKTIPLF